MGGIVRCMNILFALIAILYSPLDPNRAQVDCAADTTVVCRVRKEWTVDELRARAPMTRDGDTLTFVHESDAEAVELAGGVQYPLSRVEGTNLWTVTVRVPRLDEAMITYGFMETKGGTRAGRRIASQTWRGPKAPKQLEKATTLSGAVVKHEIESAHLKETRGLTIYEPAGKGKLAGVVYAGDGEAVDAFAKVLDPLVASGRLPRILVVGIHSSTSNEGRGAEYLTGFVDGDAPFLKHERFFLDEVMPWVEKQYALPDDAARRALFGFSNSAAWALETTLRHPRKFGRVLAFSPAGRRPKSDEVLPEKVRFYFLAGTMEKGFRDIAVRWAKTAEERGVVHVLRLPVAGHDFEMWTSMLPDALQWAFGGTKREA